MKRYCMGALVLMTAGCTALPDWSLFSTAKGPAGLAAPSQFHFDWRISGDQDTAPLQVFDDGKDVWLQFASQEYTPALFARTRQGLIPLAFRRQGPYVVVEGMWPVLVARGGSLQTVLERVSPFRPVTEENPATDRSSAADDLQEEAHSIRNIGSSGVVAAAKDVADSVPGASITPKPRGDHADSAIATTEHRADHTDSAIESQVVEASPMAAAVQAFTLEQEPAVYRVGPQDQNMRLTLERWARAAGWTFRTEHWVVEVDIPIVGEASFAPPFQSAV